MKEKPCDAVIHFAAYIAVGESMKIPEVYFQEQHGGIAVAVDGDGGGGDREDRVLVDGGGLRDAGARADSGIGAQAPVNAYGESKVMVEKLLDWFDQIHGMRSVCLRYFNASGADSEGRAGRGPRSGDAPDPAAVPGHTDGQTGHAFRRRL